jgi:hypothetical protein
LIFFSYRWPLCRIPLSGYFSAFGRANSEAAAAAAVLVPKLLRQSWQQLQ